MYEQAITSVSFLLVIMVAMIGTLLSFILPFSK